MPTRTFSATTAYRYGFGGQEKSDEIKGEGNSYTALFWEYDPKIGRRWNVDPVINVSEGSYVCFSNNPIFYNDPFGDFKRRFGAVWHSIFHGGGKVGKNEFGEWYVAKTKVVEVSQNNTTVTTANFYGKGRHKATALGERLLAEVERKAYEDHMVNIGVYQRHETVQEANEATFKNSVGVLMPNFFKGATGAFNSAKTIEQTIPKGFQNVEQFLQAGGELKTALQSSGISFSQVGVRGSAVTNISSKGGAFRETALGNLKASDIDVYIELTQEIGLKASQNIEGFIHPAKMMKNYPALAEWSEKWSKILGREITPGAFKAGTLKDPKVINF